MQTGSTYLDLQARVGITKHIGGFEATDRLLKLCHIESARKVLYVGCGIGVGPTYIAKKFGCHVIGVDISEKMLAWSRQRAREENVTDRVEFRNGNILALPFEDESFDAVIVESVIAFVDDKALAIRECARVTRTGGCVGLNELFWNKPVSAEVEASTLRELGAVPITLEAWQSLWDRAKLADKILEVCAIDERKELRGRLRWVGARWALRAIGRLIALYLSDPNARKAVKEQWSGTLEKSSAMSYGLFAGKK
jgi:ubiquinone/menaquinone biosynthesis C-methylase UbiE